MCKGIEGEAAICARGIVPQLIGSPCVCELMDWKGNYQGERVDKKGCQRVIAKHYVDYTIRPGGIMPLGLRPGGG